MECVKYVFNILVLYLMEYVNYVCNIVVVSDVFLFYMHKTELLYLFECFKYAFDLREFVKLP